MYALKIHIFYNLDCFNNDPLNYRGLGIIYSIPRTVNLQRDCRSHWQRGGARAKENAHQPLHRLLLLVLLLPSFCKVFWSSSAHLFGISRDLYFLFFSNWLVLSTIPEYGDLGQGLATFFPGCALQAYRSFKMPSSLFATVVCTFAYQPRYLLQSTERHFCFYFQAPHLQFLFAIMWVSPSPVSTPCVAPVWEMTDIKYLLHYRW